MDKSCFNRSKFPNCIYLADTYDEEENDDDRVHNNKIKKI